MDPNAEVAPEATEVASEAREEATEVASEMMDDAIAVPWEMMELMSWGAARVVAAKARRGRVVKVFILKLWCGLY